MNFQISALKVTSRQTHEMPNEIYGRRIMYYTEDMATDHPERFILSE